MEYLFISYTPSDEEFGRQLANRLETAGYKIWLDAEEDGAGDELGRQTVFAIERSDALLLLLSPDSVESERVQRKFQLAENSEKPIISLVVRPVTLPAALEQRLSGIQAIELSHDFDAGFDQLLAWLEQGDVAPVDTGAPQETLDGEYGEIPKLPSEEPIWAEDGYYWFKNWRTLTRVKALLTTERLIFFWDRRDSWKWKANEWEELDEEFPISLLHKEIAEVGQIQKPKKVLIFTTSEPFVEITTGDGIKHKITLQRNFEERVEQLQRLVSQSGVAHE